MSTPRKMPGCAKIRRNNKISLVVAGGQNGRNNDFLKSVEIVGIDVKTNSASTWVTLGEMNFARAYFPSVGFNGPIYFRIKISSQSDIQISLPIQIFTISGKKHVFFVHQ